MGKTVERNEKIELDRIEARAIFLDVKLLSQSKMGGMGMFHQNMTNEMNTSNIQF